MAHKSTLSEQLCHSIVIAFTLQDKETVNLHGLLWNGGFSGFTVDLVDLIMDLVDLIVDLVDLIADLVDLIVDLVDLMLNPEGQGC